MDASGLLSPIDTARAQLQEQIGLFLAARARLDRLKSNSSPSVQSQANGLYAVQIQLEDSLYKDILPTVQKATTGVWDTSTVLQLGSYTAELAKQLSDVAGLERVAGVTSSPVALDADTMAIAIPAILIVGLLGGWLLTSK